jgi:hypothetical protein
MAESGESPSPDPQPTAKSQEDADTSRPADTDPKPAATSATHPEPQSADAEKPTAVTSSARPEPQPDADTSRPAHTEPADSEPAASHAGTTRPRAGYGAGRQNMRKASTVVTLGTLGVLSLMVVGFCQAQDDYEKVAADCVDMSDPQPDGSYTVVDDDYCDENHYHGTHGAYGWYYGGVRSGLHVSRGTTVKPADVEITSRSGRVVQRGGFGFHSGGGG